MKLLITVLAFLFIYPTLVNPVFALNSDLVFSEFAAVTEGTKESPDWVEIYNKGDKTISMEGWVIKDSTDSNKIDLNGCIKGGSYRKFDFSNRLNNSGDMTRIFDKNSALIEAITYFTQEIPPHLKGGSIERDIQNNSWAKSSNPTPTNNSCSENSDNTGSVIPNISLSEVYPAPDQGSDEWVELFNPNTNAVTLSGWYLLDAADHKKSISGTISAKSYKAFYFPSGYLNNSGDTISLFNPVDKFIEKYSFGKADSEQSFVKDSRSKWQLTSTPTPNKLNKITGPAASALSVSNSQQVNTSGGIEDTGLQPTIDYVSGALQFDAMDPNQESQESGKVAGVSKSNSKNSVSTLLISAGFAFLVTAIAWPFLEKYKII